MALGGQRHDSAALPPGMTRYPLYRRLGRPQDRSGRVLKISPPPGFDPRTVQRVASRYTNWAIPPTLCFSVVSLFVDLQFNPLSLPATDSQSFRISVKILAGLLLLGGSKWFFFFFTGARTRSLRPWRYCFKCAFPFSYQMLYFDRQLFLRPLLLCHVSYTCLSNGEVFYFLYLSRKRLDNFMNIRRSWCKISANIPPPPILNKSRMLRHILFKVVKKNFTTVGPVGVELLYADIWRSQ
jgi:hypothetical protein